MNPIGAPRSWIWRGYGDAAISAGNRPSSSGRWTSARSDTPSRITTATSSSQRAACAGSERFRYVRPVVCGPFELTLTRFGAGNLRHVLPPASRSARTRGWVDRSWRKPRTAWDSARIRKRASGSPGCCPRCSHCGRELLTVTMRRWRRRGPAPSSCRTSSPPSASSTCSATPARRRRRSSRRWPVRAPPTCSR